MIVVGPTSGNNGGVNAVDPKSSAEVGRPLRNFHLRMCPWLHRKLSSQPWFFDVFVGTTETDEI